ncbi:MAG: hypothetical protein Q8R82_21450 [Hyphomonadaceae bacterium]|nr:hypothetical protein [Hyphomonadaceae bacterium]
MWSSLTATPLERPAVFDGPTTTAERASAFAVSSAEAFTADTSDGVGARGSEWWEFSAHMTRINGEIRTSLIVDPPNGKMPYSDAGRARLKAEQAKGMTDFDGPEGRPSTERCLVGGSGATGAPLFVPRYNANYQIVQTPDHLVISMEQNRDVRIVRLNGAPRLPPEMRRWMGDSVGWWEGDTLVVETINFVPGDAFKPASPLLVSHNARVTERFTRIAADELLYAYTVEDPDVFSRTWRVEMVLSATSNTVLEYACHEGNYSMAGMLAGGRAKEKVRK